MINVLFPPQGKNLYNSATDTLNTAIRANNPVGEILTERTGYNLSDYIRVKPNTTYTINYNHKSDATAAGMVFFSDNNPNSIVGSISLYYQVAGGGDKTYYTFTTASNCNYLRFTTPPSSFDVQLEESSEPTAYEVFNGVIYGGYVDPIAGEIVTDRALFTIDGTQTVQVRETYATTNTFRISKTQFPIEPLSYNKDDIASYMSVDINNTFSIPWTFYCNGTTKALHFILPKTFTTVTQVQEYFSQNPLQVCVHIEPIHYPIDSNTLLTLRGINNIWSTANGDIAATYYTHGDQSTQWLPGEPIIDDNNMILTTSNGYAIGKEDDYIVY